MPGIIFTGSKRKNRLKAGDKIIFSIKDQLVWMADKHSVMAEFDKGAGISDNKMPVCVPNQSATEYLARVISFTHGLDIKVVRTTESLVIYELV